MANIIEIVEENNILSFKNEPMKIVCGNTNYSLHFNFSEEWQAISKKMAVFVVDGKKTTVEFEGCELSVPAMPNASTCFVYVIGGGENEESFISSALKLRLIESPDATVEDDFEGFKNYLSLALEKLKQFEQGNYVAKTAEESLTQVDLSSNQTIAGTKDFVDELKFKGNEVAVLSQFSNPNLLINGDFKINQRNKTTHQGKNGVYVYAADRWRILGQNTALAMATKKVTIYKGHTFSQIIEIPAELKGKTVTGCFNVSEFTKEVTVFLTDGVNEVTKTLEVGDNILTLIVDETAESVEFGLRGVAISSAVYVQYAKLERGDKFTGFNSRPEAQELLECQRYFYRKTSESDYGTLGVGCGLLTPEVRIVVDCPTVLRTSPTMKMYGSVVLGSVVDETVSTYSIYSFDYDSVTVTFESQSITAGMGAILRKGESKSYIEFDAEIY